MNQPLKYVQYFPPDWDRILKIILEFKGERTMAQYAEDCNISPSTLSRIATRKATRPLPSEMIIQLYNNRNTETEYELDDLLKANGMIDDETHRRLTFKTSTVSAKEIRSRETKMQAILNKALLNRGVALKIEAEKMTRREYIERESDGSLILRPDLTITLPDSEDTKTWIFEFKALTFDGGDSPVHQIRVMAKHMFERSAIYLLADAWVPEKYRHVKTSFVFADEMIYEVFREFFRNNRLHNAMSTILIDLDTEKVIKEETLNFSRSDEQPSLFDLPDITKDEADEYEEDPEELPFITEEDLMEVYRKK